MSKVVFVGNVPYTLGEEQLIEVFKSVGEVVGFRLVFDRDTGKPKGYGFCEFADHETAESAVRNLNSVEVGGRQLRIDLADSDPLLEGKTTVRGELLDSGDDLTRSGGGGADQKSDFMSNLPQGITLPPGVSAMDSISQILASMPTSELTEVLAQMKAFAIARPEQARQLLVANPQLAYALFQALLLNNVVDPGVLQAMLKSTTGGPYQAPHPQPPSTPIIAQPPPNIGPPPTRSASMPSVLAPQALPAYNRPPMSATPPTMATPPQQQQQSTPAQPDVPDINEEQRAMLMQVLSLTTEQISALPEQQRQTIQQLRAQFMGPNA